MLSLIGLILGKALSALPFVAKLWEKRSDGDHEYRMAKLEADTRKDEAVARVTELTAQVAALQATAEIVHQQALDRHEEAADRAEQAVLDSMRPQDLPAAEQVPRSFGQWLLAFPVVALNFYNGILRPYTATVVITGFVGLVLLQFWAMFVDPTLQPRVVAFAVLPTVEVLGASYGLIVGALWGERGWSHRFEKK